MLVNGTIPNLIQGVSQEQPSQRLPTHCDLADNCWLSPSDGLAKRPPTKHIATVINTNYPDRPFIHWINRSETEQYVMVMTSGAISVFDLAGNSYGVYPQAPDVDLSYLNCTTPDQQLKALTVADTTFVVNTSVVVGVTSGQTVPNTVASFWVRTAILGGSYKAVVNGVSATYTAASTGNVTTDGIAAGLATAMVTALGSGYTVTTTGSTICVQTNPANTNNITVDCLDSGGGTALTAVVSQTALFSNLPPNDATGHTVKVVGAGTQAVPYFVKFTASNGAFGNGVWQEVGDPAATGYVLPTANMPRQLVRLVDVSGSVTGTPGKIYFAYQRPLWNTRTAGDSVKFAPDPSLFTGYVGGTNFMGPQLPVGTRTINDIFLYQNRLGFLTDTNVLLSQVGNFLNFFRTTMLSVLDSDPIDVAAAHPRVVKLRHAVNWQQEMVIFADNVQFVLGAGGAPVSPATISMTAASEYDVDLYARPVPVANLLYFPYRVNGYSALREYYVEYYTQRRVGKPVTAHVPKYITGNPIKLQHCVSSDYIGLITDGDRGSVYTYKWQWEGNTLYSTQKLQSAWSRWNFDLPGVTTKVYSIFFIGQTGYMLIGRQWGAGSGQVYLDSFTVDSNPLDASTNYTTYLDRRLDSSVTTGNAAVTTAYNGGTNQTTYTLPYPPPPGTVMQIVTKATDSSDGGFIVPIVSSGSQTLTVNGDWRTQPVWIGNSYTMRYRVSSIYMREQTGQPGQPTSAVLNGRFQLRTITVRFTNTGYFRFEITPEQRDINVVPFTGIMPGESAVKLGQVPLRTGQLRTLVGAKADRVTIDIVNDSFLPSRFSSAEWEGFYYPRARRQ